MSFKDNFLNRLQNLHLREVQEFPKSILPGHYRPAAVLLLFWPAEDGRVEVLLTKRTETVISHRGETSFPGGGAKSTDNSLQTTALRETREETGIDSESINIMGRLDDAWSRAGHHVIPFVGWLQKKPEFTPDPREVDEIIIADAEMLMQPDISEEHKVVINDVTTVTHAFRWEGSGASFN
ncbi:MAG: CoA pyrophosphatase [Proteobacteria bacterium]|nr:CoA pyrophosphatase [Pseudomonadota bacterium]